MCMFNMHHVRIQIYIPLNIFMCVYVHMEKHTYIHMYICLCNVCLNIDTHTCTHTYTHAPKISHLTGMGKQASYEISFINNPQHG